MATATTTPELAALATFPPPAGTSVYLVGVGGSGMQALARLLVEAGCNVTGSDADLTCCEWLAKLGVRLVAPRPATAPLNSAGLVVHSIAVPSTHPELERARRHAIPILTLPECLGRLGSARQIVAVAGTHGKSTTVAMLGAVLTNSRLDPTVLAGAAWRGGVPLARWGGGSHAVLEACEYRGSFFNLQPRLSVIHRIDRDHFDCYATDEELHTAFGKFVERTATDGRALVDASCRGVRRSAVATGIYCETFAIDQPADWQATELERTPRGYSFTVRHHGRFLGRITLSVWGRHNVTNALAAAAAAALLGVATKDIIASLEQFRGLACRLEPVANVEGRMIIRDYAHHPVAVAAALRAVREALPQSRIVCLFEPHQVSRTAALLDEFAHSLNNADSVLIAPVLPAREPQYEGTRLLYGLACQLAEWTRQSGAPRVAAVHSVAEAAARLVGETSPGDAVLVLGAGKLKDACDGVIDGLRRHRAA